MMQTWHTQSIDCSNWAANCGCTRGVVRAELALTFAGLMSLDTFEEVQHKLKIASLSGEAYGFYVA